MVTTEGKSCGKFVRMGLIAGEIVRECSFLGTGSNFSRTGSSHTGTQKTSESEKKITDASLS